MPKIFIHTDGENGNVERNFGKDANERFLFLLKLIDTSIKLNGGKPLKAPTAKYIFRKKNN
ncbi:MAG: hypothetical protein JWN78_1328 [Bacteroidota bacterium]|nr:hypothetical protein [Bacteroidota bacterium]